MKKRTIVVICLTIVTMILICSCSTIESLFGIQFSSSSEDEKTVNVKNAIEKTETDLFEDEKTVNVMNSVDKTESDLSENEKNVTIENSIDALESEKIVNKNNLENNNNRIIKQLSKMATNGYAGVSINDDSYIDTSMVDGPYTDLPFYLVCSSDEGWGVIYPDLSNTTGIFEPEPIARSFGVYSFNTRSVRARACDGYFINDRNEIFIFPEWENSQINHLTDQIITELQVFFSDATTIILHVTDRETNSSSYSIGTDAEKPITYSLPLDQINYIYEFLDKNLNYGG